MGFWFLSSLAGSTWSLVTFYVWTGLFATVAVVQFWLLLGDVLDSTQAKRVFAFIGAGGLVGAVLGSGLASAVLLELPAQALLVAASLLFVVASFVPFLFSRVRRQERAEGAGLGVLGRSSAAEQRPVSTAPARLSPASDLHRHHRRFRLQVRGGRRGPARRAR